MLNRSRAPLRIRVRGWTRNLLAHARSAAMAAASAWLIATPAHAGEAAAASFPQRPITIVVTFAPGGGTDLLARKLAAVLETALRQPVIVDNRPGASGNIGASHVARAEPDGHTLLMVNSSFAINPGVYGPLNFSPSRDFTTVINAGFVPSVIVVPAHSPLQTLADLLQAGRPPADPILFASCGAGTPQHLAGEMLHLASGTAMQQVAYKGCGPALADVAAGHVGVGIVTTSSAAPMLASGRLRALAVTAPARSPQLPQVPTVAEQGVAGYALDQWHGLLAPAGTPPAVIQRLNAILAHALQQPGMRADLQALGYTLTEGPQQSQEAFAELLRADLRRFSRLTARLQLRPQ